MSWVYLGVTFITSFSTMSYAMVLSSLVSDFTGEEILAQCLTMGPYLLGLGLGSVWADKVSLNKTLKALWAIEWMSVLILPLIPLIHITFIFLVIHFSPMNLSLESKGILQLILGFSSLLGFGTGMLGGAQLPLIIKEVKEKVRPEVVLALNYMGPLFAGPFIVLCQTHSLPPSTQIGYVALFQLVGLALLLTQETKRLKLLVLMIFPLLIIIGVNKIYPRFEYLTIKASYIGTRMSAKDLLNPETLIRTIENYGDLERTRTPYQVIDFFTSQGHPELLTKANGTLFLNRRTQFDLYAVDVYHESMVYGGMNLLNETPKKVLILGAGDGLLLKELKNFPEIEKITMVELDKGIVDWSKDHPVISTLNQHVFDDLPSKVDIHFADAISFLRTNKSQMYDLILIDFPFPNGHELSKLYSFEFYSMIKNVLSPHGLVVIDLPVQREISGELTLESRVILKTLNTAGFINQLPFGPNASFIAVKTKGETLEFKYEKFPNDLSLGTKLNLVRLTNEEELKKTEKATPVNSMFWPRGH